MCFKLDHKGLCYLIAIWAYLVGLFEMGYGGFMLARFGPTHYWLLALVLSWIPILIVAICLVVGVCLPDSQKRTKVILIKIWIIVAVACGCVIVIIKVVILIEPWLIIGIWRNVLRIVAFFLFILLVFCFAYYPFLYVHYLEVELDF